MKKITLFVMIILSINVLAQNKHQLNYNQYRKLNFIENNEEDIKNVRFEKFSSISIKNIEQMLKHQYSEPVQLIQIYDSIFSWEWDTQSLEWVYSSKKLEISYNEYHYLVSAETHKWNGFSWEKWYKYTITYDENNNHTSQLYQDWINNSWENTMLYTYTFDGNNNLTSNLVQQAIGNDWENYLLRSYTFDANNNLISYIIQGWESSTWQNQIKVTYTYDANNNEISSLNQSWNNNIWENSSQKINTYDNNNNKTIILAQDWGGNDWENYKLSTFNYNTYNNRIDGLIKSWNGSDWEDDEKYTYTYDESNNLTSLLLLFWTGSTWVNFILVNSSYSPDNFLISDSYRLWNNEGTVLEYGDSTYIYFHTILGLDDLALQKEGNVFPNPCYGIFTINSTINIISVEIYNLFGELVYAIPNSNRQTSLTVDLSNEPKGIYFIKMNVGGQAYTRKIIVQ